MLSRRRVFLLLYAASGAAALVYEVAWTRLLTLQMGHTVAAASTVLAAFMGGLALGSWLGGRFDAAVQRGSSHPAVTRLRAYATCEAAIGIVAITLPALLGTFVPLLSWAYHDGLTPATFGAVRVVLAVALLVVPAMAMGATFPIAVGWYADGTADAGQLYATNTAGAAVGALATGFWLIPSIGLRATTWVGVALNIAAAAGAFWLASLPAASGAPAVAQRDVGKKESRPGGKGTRRPQRSLRPSAPMPLVATAAAAISGFVALVYEIGWTRLLVLVIGPTTYAFTTVVASFIFGLAIGAAAGARVLRRSSQPARWLGAMLVVTALGASAAGWFAASRLPLVVAAQVANPEAAFAGVVTRQALWIALLLLPMTCALGAVFPFALATRSGTDVTGDRHDVAPDAARVYAWNTLGAITGSLVGGFALLPALGIENTFRAAAAVGILAALGIWIAAARSEAPGRVAAMACAFAVAAAIVVFLPRWDQKLLASGAYKYAPYIRLDDLETELRTWRLLYYADGAAATVAVRELAGMRSLAIDGKVDASNMGDMLTQRLLGLLPVLLHRDPQDICVIGLGSGVTVASALAPGTVRSADVVEISPEVVTASSFFERENGRVLDTPGVRLIVGDGRSHLLLTSRRYDVIVSEPSNPWMAGIAALFTREFFEAARARLKPDGIICQWAHTYDMRPDDLRSIVRTFGSVFPDATMWLVGEGDLLLIASHGGAIDLAGLGERAARGNTAAALEDVAVPHGAAPFALLSMFAGGPAELKQYGRDAPIQRDDRMALEFSAPRAIYGRMTDENAKAIRALAAGAHVPPVRAAIERATDANWTAAGAMELKADAHDVAYEHFQRAVRLNSRNADALSGLSDAAAGAQRQEEARAWLQSLANAEPGNASVRIELSRLLAATGNFDRAIAVGEEAMRLAPDDPRAGEQLASVLADAGDGARLGSLAERLVARFPDRDKPRFYRATALLLVGRTQEAIAEARQLLSRDPKDGRTQNLLGVACATAGLGTCAVSAFQAALAANPRDAATYVNLGVYRLQSGDPAGAIEAFSTGVTLDRSSAAARQGLADARAALAGR